MPVDLKKDDMGDVVKDFYKSDAPQFKGKSKKKRREMAIAAKLGADEVKEGKLDKIMNIVRKYSNKKKPKKHVYPAGASGGDAGEKAAKVIRDKDHKKYVNFLPAPK